MKKFAVVKIKNDQVKVSEGDVILVDTHEGEAGTKLNFAEVLLISDKGKTTIGTPTIAKSSVEAEIVSQTKADKVYSFKYKSKAHYRRKRGHRQDLTEIKINKIS